MSAYSSIKHFKLENGDMVHRKHCCCKYQMERLLERGKVFIQT